MPKRQFYFTWYPWGTEYWTPAVGCMLSLAASYTAGAAGAGARIRCWKGSGLPASLRCCDAKTVSWSSRRRFIMNSCLWELRNLGTEGWLEGQLSQGQTSNSAFKPMCSLDLISYNYLMLKGFLCLYCEVIKKTHRASIETPTDLLPSVSDFGIAQTYIDQECELPLYLRSVL